MSGISGLVLSLALLAPPAVWASQAPPAAAGWDPPRAARLAREILADPRFQRAAGRLPAAGGAADGDGDARREPGGGDVRAERAVEGGLPAAPAVPVGAAAAAGGAAALLFKAVLVCVLTALLLALLGRLLAGRRRAEQPVATAAPAAARVRGAGGGLDLEAADRLAAAGHYGEAVHLLLLVAIGRLSERAARPPAASRTSRELVRLLPLEGAARDAFAAVVALVERTLFGGRVAAAGDFQAARAQTLLVLLPAAGSHGRDRAAPGNGSGGSEPGGERR